MADVKKLTSFIVDTGFIWGPSPEIYGGLAGFYEYGPLGKLLKNNVEDAIRSVFRNNGFFEVECPTVSPKAVWEASGHLSGFTDPLVLCSACSAEFRVDKLLEDAGMESAGGLSKEQMLTEMSERKIACTSCKGELKKEIVDHNLMMKTTVGLDTEAYNRPETATTTYLPFKRFDNFFRKKYPFSVFQIGKAYRNEISPRQMVMRGREFTQAEGQIFLFESQKHDFAKFDASVALPLWFAGSDGPVLTTLGDAIKEKKLKNKAYAWCLGLAFELYIAMGIPADRLRMRQHASDEKAFYADDAWDIEVNLNSYGWYELCGVHDRTDYDLKQHGTFSKQNLMAFNETLGTKEVPHVLELAFGTDRPTFALLDIFYDDSGDRKVFRVPALLAPIKLAVFPLVNKLKEDAMDVFTMLSRFYPVFDASGSVGRRYARADEQGIPYCVTVDFETREDNCVTIRERDSQEQRRVSIASLVEELGELLK